MTAVEKAEELRRLHTAPELLVLVNVWDAISATVVESLAGCHGFPDGQAMPLDLMMTAIERIAAAVALPVTADLEAGYGDAATTVRRAIQAGAVGGNLEDEMRPLGEVVAAVSAAVSAAEAEGVPFVLNARTDAFLKAGDRDPALVLADAIERGRAFLEAGADCVFVPGRLDIATVRRLVEGIGERRVSLIGLPGTPPQSELAAAGVARLSFGPWSQRVALTALADTGAELLSGAPLPDGVRALT
jgi:2-methylisocitrate lyase-like PEP mutase family enzyme